MAVKFDIWRSAAGKPETSLVSFHCYQTAVAVVLHAGEGRGCRVKVTNPFFSGSAAEYVFLGYGLLKL